MTSYVCAAWRAFARIVTLHDLTINNLKADSISLDIGCWQYLMLSGRRMSIDGKPCRKSCLGSVLALVADKPVRESGFSI